MLTRWAFNSGEFSPLLRYRSDLARYRSACILLDNFIVRPQGPVTTRGGLESLAILESEECYRLISFPGSADEGVELLFRGDAASTCTLEIWKDDRLLTTLATDYLGADLADIAYYQSYDVIFLFHGSYSTKRVERQSDTEFSIVGHAFTGGPWEPSNAETSSVISVDTNEFDPLASYDEGDSVSTGTTYVLTGTATRVYLYTSYVYVSATDNEHPLKHYATRITCTTPLVAPTQGDRLTIGGGSTLAGDWEVVAFDLAAGTLDLKTGTTYLAVLNQWTNDYHGVNVNTDPTWITGQKFTFFVSIQNGNIGNTPSTSPTWWREGHYAVGTVGLSSNFDAFTADDVGRKVRLKNSVTASDKGVWGPADEGAVTKVLPAYGTVTLKTEGGVWAGEVYLQQSIDGGVTWEDLGLVSSEDGTQNGVITREVTKFGTLVRGYLKERSAAAADTGCYYYLDVAGNQYTYFTITAFTDTRAITAVINNGLWSWLSTSKWSMGVFCETNGYPSCGTLFEERFVIGGVPRLPMNVYMSATNDFTDFQDGIFATSPLNFSLPSSIRQAIKWLLPKQELLIGTDGGEWTLGARGIDQVLSYDNVRAKRHTDVGSEGLQAVSAKDTTLYVERGGKAIRGLAYEFAAEGYVTTDMSILASHLTDDATIVEVAYLKGDTPTLYCLLSDGELISFTYEKSNDVSAWARHTITGTVKAISADGQDRLWLVVVVEGEAILARMQQSNLHMDRYQTITTDSAASVWPTRTVDTNATLWDDKLQPISTLLYGKGQFVRTTVPDVDAQIDGEWVKQGVDFVKIPGYLPAAEHVFWFPYGNVLTLYIKGSLTEIHEGIDKFTYDASQCVTFQVFDWSALGYVWSDFTVKVGGVVQTRGTDWFSSGNFVGVIPNAVGQTVEVIYDYLVPTEYTMVDNKDMEIMDAINLYCPADGITAQTTFGIPMTSLMTTTDMLSTPETGPPMGTGRVSELEVGVANSVGGDFRFDESANWQPLYQAPADVVMGELPVPYTGRKIVNLNSGYQQEGLFLQVKTDAPHHMTLTHVGALARRSK